ncbi:MAG TPA: hypothetical protein VD790_13180 [Thermoleophilaceae bacterium]|nr:hypothetical protein [Thermoleophilaceae bacterium]
MKVTGPTSAEITAPVAAPHAGWRGLVDRTVAASENVSRRPLTALAETLAIGAGLAVCFTAFGWVLLDDQAAFYRELMPGTWLSAALLLFTAATAIAIHRAAGVPGKRDFWSISAIVFVALAIDELTQPTVFLSKWLRTEHQIAAPAPFNDVDSMLVVALLVTCVAVLLRHALVLRRHRTTIVLFAIGLTLGAVSQTLDSVVEPTKWEFVAEECLKLSAIPFVLAGYLAALRDVRGSGIRDAASQQSDASSAPKPQPASTSVG